MNNSASHHITSCSSLYVELYSQQCYYIIRSCYIGTKWHFPCNNNGYSDVTVSGVRITTATTACNKVWHSTAVKSTRPSVFKCFNGLGLNGLLTMVYCLHSTRMLLSPSDIRHEYERGIAATVCSLYWHYRNIRVFWMGCSVIMNVWWSMILNQRPLRHAGHGSWVKSSIGQWVMGQSECPIISVYCQ